MCVSPAPDFMDDPKQLSEVYGVTEYEAVAGGVPVPPKRMDRGASNYRFLAPLN